MVEAHKLQNIIMQLGSRHTSEVAIHHLHDCPISKGDIQVADDILGPNLGSLKGKTVWHPNPHVKAATEGVLHDIMKLHQSVTLAIDAVFVNKVPFLITISQNLMFGTVEALSNHQVSTIVEKLKNATKLYGHRGFCMETIMADQEFELI